jgi:hypothetical protein
MHALFVHLDVKRPNSNMRISHWLWSLRDGRRDSGRRQYRREEQPVLRLKSNLSVEQCIERLGNAIDPIPLAAERAYSGNKTTWSPDPLPGAGRRTTGFGYAAGTRPVVGTISGAQFRLEKRLVNASFGEGYRAVAIIDATCTGRVTKSAEGTLVELDSEQPNSSSAHVVLLGLVAIIFGLMGISLLLNYLSGVNAAAPSSAPDPADTGGWCVLVLLLIGPLIGLLENNKNTRNDREYLISFVKQVCEAILVVGPEPQGSNPSVRETRDKRNDASQSSNPKQ